jgi:APA family basic amino acid/polyamine antiporter
MLRNLVNRVRFGPMSTIGAGALFMVVYIAAASSLYFALGLIAEQSLAMTPFVMVAGGVFFVFTFMSYVEGSSLHIERGGASSFARYAFDELVSFIAGWAILLDYAIVLALVASAVPNYLAVFWSPLQDKAGEMIIPVVLIALMIWSNIRGVSAETLRRRLPLGWIDFAVLIAIIVVGICLLWSPGALTDNIDLGTAPTWKGLFIALILSTVAGTGIESASGLAGEIKIGRRELKSVVAASTASTITIFTGISMIALMADPVTVAGGGESTAIADQYVENPVIGVVRGFHGESAWASDLLAYVVGIVAVITLVQAARIYVLGPMRVTYALATNRQIPSFVGRLHPKYGTPYISAIVLGIASSGLAMLDDPELLVAIFAFGAVISFAIANLSIIRLRFREPAAFRAYRVPFSIPIGGGSVPLPSLIAFLGAVAALVGVVIFRHTATLVGGIWLLLGLALYVSYRKTQGKPLRTRVTIPEEDLRRKSARETSKEGFGSILVPVFGGVLDDDIIGTAGRLAMEEGDDEGAMIEALHVIEIPMSQPIDAPVPADRLQRARKILARAKEVGEEYEGVEVATATVRARSTGEAIVREAGRRGVEVIVLAAERPSRVRGGPLLGGVEPRAAEFIGKVTEYVTRKAPCRVILTAPPETEVSALVSSIAANPHVSEDFAKREADRAERMAGITAEHSPVDPGVAHTGGLRPHEAEADHKAVAEDEDPDDFIDTIS